MPASFAFGLFLIYMAIKSRLPQVKLFDYAMLAVWALLLGHSSAGDRPRQVDLELAEGSARAGHAQQSFSVNQLQSPSAISASAYLCAWNCCSSHIACSPLEESRHLCLQNTYKKQSRKTSGSKFSSKHVLEGSQRLLNARLLAHVLDVGMLSRKGWTLECRTNANVSAVKLLLSATIS